MSILCCIFQIEFIVKNYNKKIKNNNKIKELNI